MKDPLFLINCCATGGNGFNETNARLRDGKIPTKKGGMSSISSRKRYQRY